MIIKQQSLETYHYKPFNYLKNESILFNQYFSNSNIPPAAHAWFTLGMGWICGFQDEEGMYCFHQASLISPNDPLINYMIAFSNLPHYNHAEIWEESGKYPSAPDMRQYAKLALENLPKNPTTTAEKLVVALVEALQIHAGALPYPGVEADYKLSGQKTMGRSELLMTYCKKMEIIFENPEFDDMHVAYLYVESMTNQRPWGMYDLDKLPIPANDIYVGTTTIDETLTAALVKYPEHPGLTHLCIHFHEMGAQAEKALPACHHLVNVFEAENGHLMHMPSHIFIQTGDWGIASTCNTHAVDYNRKYEDMIRKRYPDKPYSYVNTFFNVFYRLHDSHMLAFASMMKGDKTVALEALAIVDENLARYSKELPETYGSSVFVDGFASMTPHVLVRFGDWSEILKRSTKEKLATLDPKLHITQKTAWLYARAMALTSLVPADNQSDEFTLEKAQEAFDEFSTYLEEVKDAMHFYYFNTNYAVMSIGRKVAEAELLYRKAEFEVDLEQKGLMVDRAFDLLAEGRYMSDKKLQYVEPWGWMHPVRHIIGALALEQGRLEVAKQAYLEDIGLAEDPAKNAQCIMKKNIWALRGLDDTYKALIKQNGTLSERDQNIFKQNQLELSIATSESEVTVTASCACKRSWKDSK